MRVWQSRNQDIYGYLGLGQILLRLLVRQYGLDVILSTLVSFHWVALDPRFPHVSEPGRHIKIQSKQIKTVWVKWIEKLLQRQDTVGFPISFFFKRWLFYHGVYVHDHCTLLAFLLWNVWVGIFGIQEKPRWWIPVEGQMGDGLH